jgi:hypothetical protein
MSLYWCEKWNDISSMPINTTKEPIERYMPEDTWSYTPPKITIQTSTWTIIAGLNETVQNEISSSTTKEERDNWRKVSVVSGYVFTYIYEDLWLKITTPALYEPFFYKIPKTPILNRYKNMIFFSENIRIWWEYIEMFKKDPVVPLKTMIEKHHLWSGCIAYNRLDDDPSYDFKKNTRFQSHWRIGVDTKQFFNITWPWGSLWSDVECKPDKEYPDSYWLILFVQPVAHKDRYYKISMWDACAPGPCSIFGRIEFF